MSMHTKNDKTNAKNQCRFFRFCVTSIGFPLHRNRLIVLPFVCNTDFTQMAIARDSPLFFNVDRTFLMHLQNRLVIGSFI